MTDNYKSMSDAELVTADEQIVVERNSYFRKMSAIGNERASRLKLTLFGLAGEVKDGGVQWKFGWLRVRFAYGNWSIPGDWSIPPDADAKVVEELLRTMLQSFPAAAFVREAPPADEVLSAEIEMAANDGLGSGPSPKLIELVGIERAWTIHNAKQAKLVLELRAWQAEGRRPLELERRHL